MHNTILDLFDELDKYKTYIVFIQQPCIITFHADAIECDYKSITFSYDTGNEVIISDIASYREIDDCDADKEYNITLTSGADAIVSAFGAVGGGYNFL